MTMPAIETVICFWQWDGNDKHRPWMMTFCSCVDCNGCVVGTGKKLEPDEWLYQCPSGDEDTEWIAIPGRAVTFWGWATGVSLHGLHPQEQTPEWLISGFIGELQRMPFWWGYLKGGYWLRDDTVELAKKAITEYGREPV